MLVEFSVANYRSFLERATLSMEAEPRLSERDKTVDERNIAHTPGGDLLRVAGIYGANASGKSNLVLALSTLRDMVLHSARGQDGDRVPAAPFRLNEGSRSRPSEVEVVYLEGGHQTRYGAAFTSERIVREWLYTRALPAPDEELLFERNFHEGTGADVYSTGPNWARNASFEAATRKEALHISTASQLNHPGGKTVLDWFKRLRIVNSVQDNELLRETIQQLSTGPHEAGVRSLILRLNFGLDDVTLADLEPQIIANIERVLGAILPLVSGLPKSMAEVELTRQKIQTIRNGVRFDLEDESAGTQRSIALSGPVIHALATGQTFVIDELDVRLHTLLAKQFVELFQDPEINTRDAQLIFASHDTNLLSRALMRRDQLWFTEKSPKTQASDLYSLAEIRLPRGKRVRNDASYENDYLLGRYGAIPFFGGIKRELALALSEGRRR